MNDAALTARHVGRLSTVDETLRPGDEHGAHPAGATLRLADPTSSAWFARRRPPPVPGPNRRERDVLALLADGCSTREIARRLSYSERTIKNVLQDFTTRLQLRNRTQAVAYAVRRGWI